MNLKHLTDRTLLLETKFLSQEYRYVTAKLLHHLREIEKRRLFSDLGYPSLFDYVVKELGFSESSAARRIHAARLLIEMPEIEVKIESGELNLSILTLASQTFKNENITDTEVKKEIISKIENSSYREAEKTLKDILEPKAKPRENVLKIILSDESLEKFNDLKDLLAHKKLGQDQFFGLIFKVAYERLLAERFKLNSKRETSSKDPRFITAQLKKKIYNRDNVCKKCGSKYALEIDHIKPYALGGKSNLENLRLLCRSCNQRARIKAAL